MTGYWWQCEKCKAKFEFDQIGGANSIAGFIRDVLLPSDWDQSLLLQRCPTCGENSARITYDFPRKKNPLVFRVVNIVGLDFPGTYLPMMWGSYEVTDPATVKYDFKYIEGRNPQGLTKPAIFTKDDLAELFALYCKKTSKKSFP